jgi:hypothetical protein
VIVDDPGDDVGQIDLRIDAIEFAGLDQRGDDCPMLAATIGSGEQSVLAVQRNRAD